MAFSLGVMLSLARNPTVGRGASSVLDEPPAVVGKPVQDPFVLVQDRSMGNIT
jgi:hypothetical protein